jgi:NAD(P)-dependent dehydrogenase (short-subunit alcohol dehydrogenase family)
LPPPNSRFGLSEAVRCELEGTGVTVTTVLPNLAHTRLGSGIHAVRGMKKLDPAEIAALALVAAQDAPAPERLHRWLELLIASKRDRALDDPALFATYVQLAG